MSFERVNDPRLGDKTPQPVKIIVPEVSYLSAAQLVRMGGTFLGSALVLRYFGPEGKGILAIAISVQGLVSLLQIQTGQAAQAFIPRLLEDKHYGAIKAFLRESYWIRCAAAFTISLVLYITAHRFSAFYGIETLDALIVVLAFTNLASILTGFVDQNVLIAFGRCREVLTLSLIDAVGNFMAVVATVILKWGLAEYLWAMGAAKLLACVYLLYMGSNIRRAYAFHGLDRVGDAPRQEKKNDVLRFSVPVTLTGVLSQLTSHLSVLVAGKIFALDIVGYYSFAVATVTLLWSIASLPEALLISKLSKASRRGMQHLIEEIDQGWRYALAYAACSSMVLIAFARELTWILAGPEFLPAVPLVKGLAFLLVFRAVEITRLVYYAELDPGGIFRRYAYKPAIEITGYVALIPTLGIWGIVVSGVISQGIYGFIISYGAFSRIADGKRRGYASLYRLWASVLAVCVMLSAAGYFWTEYQELTAPSMLLLMGKIVILTVVMGGITANLFRRNLKGLSVYPSTK